MSVEKITPEIVGEFLRDLVEHRSFGEVTIVMRDGAIEQVRQNLTHNPAELHGAYADRSNRKRTVFVVSRPKEST